jgi:NAD(P)H-quinone oxidoreductase subunit 5
MKVAFFTLIPLVAPVLLLLFALVSVFRSGRSRFQARLTLEVLGWSGILVAVLSSLVGWQFGTLQSGLLGWGGVGLALRLDPLSLTMFTMIALLGYIVLRFSGNYLDGDPRQHVFLARLAATIASVELLVLSGNLGQLLICWVLTSVCLHYLLIFYRHRPQAIAAARKKFIAARLGDLSLLVAVGLLYREFGTGDLDAIFTTVRNTDFPSGTLIGATVFLVLTASLKSAQFPLYGWLIEVVETPTPVSALLHAGLLNAGPFLIVRMSFLMSESVPASLLLIAIGGFTALFASVVFLTQPSVKVALGYSSIAHMGFMLLICGFGVYTAAILHLVAHSFYKAHAFLSSGSVVDSVRGRKVALPKRTGSVIRVGLSIAVAAGIYIGFCFLWGVHPEEDFTLMATGAIIVMGLSQIIAPTLDTRSNLQSTLLSGGLAFLVALAFFTLEQGAHQLLHSEIPMHYTPALAVKGVVIAVVISFALVVLLQLTAPAIRVGKWGYALGVHLRNGLYANVLFDRLIGSLKGNSFKWASLTMKEEESPAEAHSVHQPQTV